MMSDRITPFLMFEGRAEEAMSFYVSLFPDSAVDGIERWRADELGETGAIKVARFTVAGQAMRCSDSPVKHDFGFTPAISLFVTCTSDAEISQAVERLLEQGEALMPLDDYGFSRKFAWVQDRFGVSWQLNLD